METKIKKQITLELAGLDGNAFSLMGAFQRQARREGWSKEEINAEIDNMLERYSEIAVKEGKVKKKTSQYTFPFLQLTFKPKKSTL
jgi:hypothetical protein